MPSADDPSVPPGSRVRKGGAKIFFSIAARSCAAVLPIAAVLALALAIAFCGGAGVDINIFFDAMILLAIILAIALFDLSAATKRIAPILFVPILIPAILGTSEALFGKPRFSALPQLEREFQDTVQFVATRSGHAFCQNLLVCFEAARPQEICMYYTPEQIKLGRLSEPEVVNLIETYYFKTIEIELPKGGLAFNDAFTPGLAKSRLPNTSMKLRTLGTSDQHAGQKYQNPAEADLQNCR